MQQLERHAVNLPVLLAFLGTTARPALAPETAPPDAWVAFARDGTPGWDAYDRDHRATMILGTHCDLVDDPFAAERAAW